MCDQSKLKKAFAYFKFEDDEETEVPSLREMDKNLKVKRKALVSVVGPEVLPQVPNVEELARQINLLKSPDRKKLKQLIMFSSPEQPKLACTPAAPKKNTSAVFPTTSGRGKMRLEYAGIEQSDELLNCWQFNTSTGDPVYNDQQGWERYVPDEFLYESTFGYSSNISDRVLKDFMSGIRSKRQDFDVICGDGVTRFMPGNEENSLFRRIMGYELKKLKVVNRISRDKKIRITFRKLNQPLQPYPGDIPPISTVKENGHQSSTGELRERWEEDALYGTVGPGSFWCRDRKCKLRDKMTSLPVVDFGEDEQKIILFKRFTCKTQNCVYFIHCEQCKVEGFCTKYVGQTQDLHIRLNQHSCKLSLCTSRESHGTIKYEIVSDEDELPYTRY